MNSRILDAGSLTLTVYLAKKVLQIYGTIHSDLTSYTAGCSYLLEITKKNFSDELRYLQQRGLVNPQRTESVSDMLQVIKEHYKEIRSGIESLKELTETYSDEKKNDDYFHFLQFQKKIGQQVPSDISIDPFIRDAYAPPSDYANKIKISLRQLQERGKKLDSFRSEQRYHDYINELLFLNTLKQKLLREVYNYASFQRSQEQKRTLTLAEFNGLFSHTSHECDGHEIQALKNVLSHALHFTSPDYYLLLELIWNCIGQQPSPNLFWEYIDLPLKHQGISFADHEEVFYSLGVLVEPLTVATSYQKIHFSSQGPASYEKAMRSFITELSGSTNLSELLKLVVHLLNVLRIYASLKRTLFTEQMRRNQDRFESKWFSSLAAASLDDFLSHVLHLPERKISFAVLYELTLTECIETLNRIEEKIHQ